MRVLVTGSEGFIGSHMVQALLKREYEVIGADKKTGVDLSLPIEPWHPRPDCIIHLASSCSTPGSVSDPLGTFRDTVMTAVHVLEAARHQQIPVILTSSVKARDGMTPYGAAKRMVETWAFEYRSAFGSKVVINRPGTVYGPGQEGSTESGWIAWFLEALRTGQTVTINGDGEQVRDLLHVTDYIRLMLTQISNIDTYDTGFPWDVGGGEDNAVTVNEMAEYLGVTYKYGPERYGDARRYVGVNDVPGWKPLIPWRSSATLAR